MGGKAKSPKPLEEGQYTPNLNVEILSQYPEDTQALDMLDPVLKSKRNNPGTSKGSVEMDADVLRKTRSSKAVRGASPRKQAARGRKKNPFIDDESKEDNSKSDDDKNSADEDDDDDDIDSDDSEVELIEKELSKTNNDDSDDDEAADSVTKSIELGSQPANQGDMSRSTKSRKRKSDSNDTASRKKPGQSNSTPVQTPAGKVVKPKGFQTKKGTKVLDFSLKKNLSIPKQVFYAGLGDKIYLQYAYEAFSRQWRFGIVKKKSDDNIEEEWGFGFGLCPEMLVPLMQAMNSLHDHLKKTAVL